MLRLWLLAAGCAGVGMVWLLLPLPVQASGTVGGGSAGSCTQAALETRLAGGGLVTFDCGPAPVTIVLGHTDTITLNTTIEGGGVITLSGGSTTHPFDVVTNDALTLSNMTLAQGHGNVGGAIYSNGHLTLLNTNFVQNVATSYGGAIWSTGPLTIAGGLFYSNTAVIDGGAIDNSGPAAISGATFLSNTAGSRGGALINDPSGTLTIQDSTLQGNRVSFMGGAILNNGAFALNRVTLTHNLAIGSTGIGGGLAQGPTGDAQVMNSTFYANGALAGGGLVTSGTVTINNTTFISNSSFSGAGVLVETGALTVTNSTFAGGSALSGGAIAQIGSAPVMVKNTILAASLSTNCAGTITSLGHNIDDGNSCGLGATGDMPATNPLLGPLADNGGPTLTLALLPGSPAIKHGDVTDCPATDQRGFLRLGGCDIGAFEYAFRALLPLVRK